MRKNKSLINKLLDQVWTHWQWYNKLFHITIFKYFVTYFAIVPFLAKLFYKVNSLNIFGQQIILSLPFKWELLWFSALSFVLAFSLYKIFCPSFIVKYPSFKRYKEHFHSERWIIHEAKKIVENKGEVAKFFERINIKDYLRKIELGSIQKSDLPNVIVEKDQTVLNFIYDENYYSIGLPIINKVNDAMDKDKTEIVEREVFWEVFGRFSSSKPIARATILIFLAIALGLFIYVLFQNIYSAFLYMNFC